MNPETKNCIACKVDFIVESEDFLFYEKMGVQAPHKCPSCRQQQRLAFRNERTFYKRNCDKCGKSTVSMYSPNKQLTVWCHTCWFADDWDGADYAQDYDPTRPFGEQLKELWLKVPKVNLVHVNSVNCEYINIAADNKDCYMLVESSNNENLLYSYWAQICKDSVDISFSHGCSWMYECDDMFKCNKVLYSKGCTECRDSYFLFDCKNVSDCIGCVNLRNRQYCVFNEQLSKEEYEKFLGNARLDTNYGVEELRKQFEAFKLTQPHKFAEVTNAENSSGNYIRRAKNCKQCFDCYEAEDSKYGVHVWRGAKDVMDVDTVGRTVERMYNCLNSAINVSDCISTILCWGGGFMSYSQYCTDGQSLFGCVGLRKKSYCILNKQYSPEEYASITEYIIKNIREHSEYGSFLPVHMSAFGYNETAAQEQFPLTKDEALAQGYAWEDHPRGTYGQENGKDIFACQTCKKNYRFTPREAAFYAELKIPVPLLCPDCRHERRIKARGPNRLWHRSCMKPGCSNEFETSYAPDRHEIIYCETHYNAEVA